MGRGYSLSLLWREYAGGFPPEACLVLWNANSWAIARQAIFEGFSSTVGCFILGPGRIMFTNALRDSGTHFSWHSGVNVQLNILGILNRPLRTIFAALARCNASE